MVAAGFALLLTFFLDTLRAGDWGGVTWRLVATGDPPPPTPALRRAFLALSAFMVAFFLALTPIAETNAPQGWYYLCMRIYYLFS